ncbi:biotin synthase BioB [Desulfosarcina sp. OttesenSCG-928-G10]|nr:biotin synthase BioB [Desulfosarcina sp. OttesenSCG-928-G10]
MHPELNQILSEAMQDIPLRADQLSALPALLPHGLLDMMAVARIQASRFAGDFFTCGIINAKSGNCTENCRFCAQSRYHAAPAPVYPRVSFDVLQNRADALARADATYMGIVISGKSPVPADLDYFCDAVARLSKHSGIRFCASFGILSRDQAVSLRQAGFTRYHHNLETSRRFFPSICTSHTYESRIATVKNAQEAGLQVCSGGIFGMGETWDHRIELMCTLKELKVDAIPMNFLTAIAGTPFEGHPAISPQQALAVLALMRLVHPQADMIVCGGRKPVLGEWEKLVFSAGANGLMVENYLTTTGGLLALDKEMMQTLGVS